MTIPQLSIFIENRSGTLITVLEVLKQAGIQIIASTIADTAEYGIYRLICNNLTLRIIRNSKIRINTQSVKIIL